MTQGSERSVDRLALRGLRGVGHHGVFEHERRDGQEFVVDVELGLDTRLAARGRRPIRYRPLRRVGRNGCTTR